MEDTIMQHSPTVKVEIDIPTFQSMAIKEEVPEQCNNMQMTIRSSDHLVHRNAAQQGVNNAIARTAIALAGNVRDRLFQKMIELHIMISRLVSELGNEPVPALVRGALPAAHYNFNQLHTIEELYLRCCQRHALGLQFLFQGDRAIQDIRDVLEDMIKLIEAMADNNCTRIDGNNAAVQLLEGIVIPPAYIQIP